MDADRILCVYERIADLMARMVDAARGREWERLEHLESSCKELIETLKATDLDVPMPPTLRDRRTRLIGEVLRADAQIRALTEPWSARLSQYPGDRRAGLPSPFQTVTLIERRHMQTAPDKSAMNMVRAARVEALKRAVAEGRYYVDCAAIADRLLEAAREVVRGRTANC